MQILDERWRHLTDRERALLERLVEFLQGFGAPPEDASLMRRKLEDLEELFLLVIVGEFNSGKSAFINALPRGGQTLLGGRNVDDRPDHGAKAWRGGRRARAARGHLRKRAPKRFLARGRHRGHAED